MGFIKISSDSRNLENVVGKVIPLEAVIRKVTHLRFCLGLPIREISRATGLRARSVKIILNNAVTNQRRLEKV